MTYVECRNLSLHLIHQESIAGVEILGTYNNQQDYLDKIPGLINAAMMDIATTTKPIPEEITLEELYREEKNGNYIYTLPENLWQRRGSGLLVPVPRRFSYEGLRYQRYNNLRMIGNRKLVLTEKLPDETILEYYRYPYTLPVEPDDDVALDSGLPPEAQMAIPYYVAAHVVMYDDAFLYATLQNEYTAKKEALRELPTTEVSAVEDVYMGPAMDYNIWW